MDGVNVFKLNLKNKVVKFLFGSLGSGPEHISYIRLLSCHTEYNQ